MIPILIGLFGIAGVLLRYSIGQLNLFNHPLFNSTLIVNIIGCFIIGICFHYLKSESPNKIIFSSIAIGFCGGLTTFSTLMVDVYNFINLSQYTTAIAYIALSLSSGFLFLYIGHRVIS